MATGIETASRQALEQANSDAARAVLNNADLFAMFVGLMSGTLGALEGKAGMVSGLADKAMILTDVGGKVAGNKTVTTGIAGAQIIAQTLGLLKLGSAATPGVVVATVGAMFTKKVALMFGLVEDDKRAQLVSATADIAASLLSVGVAATAATNPVGWVLLAAAAAQLGASAYQGYAKYQDQ